MTENKPILQDRIAEIFLEVTGLEVTPQEYDSQLKRFDLPLCDFAEAIGEIQKEFDVKIPVKDPSGEDPPTSIYSLAAYVWAHSKYARINYKSIRRETQI